MGLVLSLHRGGDFYVEDTRVVVMDIREDCTFYVRVGADPTPIYVSRDFAVELFPDVMVSASQKIEPGIAKVIIEAPRSIGVILGDLYRNPKPKAVDAYLFGGASRPQGRHF